MIAQLAGCWWLFIVLGVCAGLVSGILSFAKDTETARNFMDFLTTPEARAFYTESGWVISLH